MTVDVSRDVLEALLTDFRQRSLSSNDLNDGYYGVPLTALKQKFVERDPGSGVDFDLALQDLESADQVSTGRWYPTTILRIRRSPSLG
jgi:hypothetical protein